MRTSLVLAAVISLAGCASHREASRSPESDGASHARIARVWRGRVADRRADEYEAYLRGGIAKFPTIPGNMGVSMMRRDLPDDSTEFVVTSYWPDLGSIRAYAGDDIEKVRDLPRDHEFLIEPERTVRHYQIKEWMPGPAR